MAKLALRHCTPIKKGTKPISSAIARSLIKQLNPGWSFNGDAKGLEQEFHFKNFHEAMGFVNAVAWIANSEDHHPDLEIGYDRCKIKLTTHAAGGLTVNDFICAAKIDALYKSAPEGTATATAEKTRAIPEPAAKTEAIYRPLPKTPELDTSEAEELLNTEIKARPPEPSIAGEEPELKLIDPDDEPTQPHLQNPPTASQPVMENLPPEAEPQEPESSTEPATTTDQHDRSANHLLTTVILPPGMHTIREDKDEDEEATVIAKPDFGPDFGEENIELSTPDDADEVRTMIVPGMPGADDQAEEENPDLLKTMIIKPPLLDGADALNSNSDGDETLLINPKSPGRNKLK